MSESGIGANDILLDRAVLISYRDQQDKRSYCTHNQDRNSELSYAEVGQTDARSRVAETYD